MPKNRRHSVATQLTRDILTKLIPSGWYVDDQEPITTADSEPEPDVLVVRGSRSDYVDRHPTPAEVVLVVEVADATLQRDRTLKLRLYASGGIPIYWILNLPAQQLEVFSQPSQDGDEAHYQQRTVYALAETVGVVIDGEEIARLSVQSLFE